MLKLIILQLLSLLTGSCLAQQRISGILTDKDNIPLVSVNVLLYSPMDTVHYLKGTASDIEGRFSFDDVPNGDYVFSFSMLGFQKKVLAISVQNKDCQLGSVVLDDVSNLLDEIVVKANLAKVFGGKREFIFSSDEKVKANSGLDLMRNIPQLTLNDIDNKLHTTKGGAVKVLVNGLMVEEIELMSLDTKNIIKVEYYSQPPARYANLGVDVVLNVVTKRSEQGGFVMVNLRNSLTTGFGTDIVQGKYTQGDNDYSLRYFIDYRDLNKNKQDQSFSYNLKNGGYSVDKIGKNGSYSGCYHVIQSIFSRVKNDNYFLNVKTTLRLNPGKEDSPSLLSGAQPGTGVMQGVSITQAHTNYLSPAVDFYLSKQLRNEQELTLNIVNTFYNSRSDKSLKEEYERDKYEGETSFRNRSYSVISEAVYAKKIGKHELNIGAKHTYKVLNENYRSGENSESSKYNIHNLYAYLSLSGRLAKWNYMVAMGGEQSWVNSYGHQTYFVLKPALSVSYKASDPSNWELKSSIRSTVPDISLLSNSPIYISPTFISRGNSELKPWYGFHNELNYTYIMPSFYLQTGLEYIYDRHPYYVVFDKDDSYAVKTYRNETYMQSLGYNLSLKWNPFKWLMLSPTYSVSYQQSKGKKYHYTHWFHYISLYASASYKMFSLNLQIYPKYKKLEGQTINQWENYYYGDVRWKKNNLSITLALLYSAQAGTLYTRKGAPVHYFETKRWGNFNGLVFAQLVYTFSFGKNKQRSVQQKLNNTDNDSGLYIDSKAKL